MVDEGTEMRQPIHYLDVAQCIINALRLEESIGETYEVGGPHQYNMLEIFEMIYNKMNRIPKVNSIPYNQFHKFMSKLPHWHGTTRWYSFNEVLESRLDLVVSPEAKTVEDLFVRPISFAQNLKHLLQDHVAKVELSNDEMEHGWWYGNDRRYEP